MLRPALAACVLALAVLSAACGKKPEPAGEPAASAAVELKDPKLRALLTLADEACACTTYACAEAKTKEIFDRMGELFSATANAKEGAEVRKAVQRAAVCKSKLPQPAAPEPGAPGAPASPPSP